MSCHSSMIGMEFSPAEIEATARSGRLLSMEIEFSLLCNFHCRYCYVGQGGVSPLELTTEESRDVILQAKALGARKIIILGGEPLLYPQIKAMLAFIREQGLAIELFTNGTNLDAEMARLLYDLGVQVVLKMNSFDETIQDELAGRKGAHQIIQEAFRQLKAVGFPSAGHVLAVSTIICSRNHPEIVAMWRWLRDQQILPYIEIMTPQGNAQDNDHLAVDLTTLHKIFDELAELDRTRYGQTWIPQPPLAGSRCFRHQFSCLVNAFGYVMPCVGVTIPIGNIRERKLADILRDSEVVEDLRNHVHTMKGPCRTCDKAAECYGCRGAAYQLTGDYLASDPLCWRNADRAQEIQRLPMALANLIPQQAPMRLADRLLSVGERVAVVEACVRDDNPFLQPDGQLETTAYLELIAQAAAAMNGFKTTQDAPQHQGYLLGARQVEVLGPARVGDVLTIHVYKATRYGTFGIIEGRIMRGDTLLARGEIKVWHTTTSAPPAVEAAG